MSHLKYYETNVWRNGIEFRLADQIVQETPQILSQEDNCKIALMLNKTLIQIFNFPRNLLFIFQWISHHKISKIENKLEFSFPVNLKERM